MFFVHFRTRWMLPSGTISVRVTYPVKPENLSSVFSVTTPNVRDIPWVRVFSGSAFPTVCYQIVKTADFSSIAIDIITWRFVLGIIPYISWFVSLEHSYRTVQRAAHKYWGCSCDIWYSCLPSSRAGKVQVGHKI